MMKIITLSIYLLIYGFQNSTVWYENEKEVGTVTLDFCKETGTSRLAIFHTTYLRLDNGYGLHWSLSNSRSMPDRRVGRQSVASRRDREVYSEVMYIWRHTHGRTNRIRITPVYSSSWHDIQGFMSVHATVTDKYIPQQDWYASLHGPSWNRGVFKSTSYYIGSVHVVQTKFYICYLLKIWATSVRGLRFD